jgi:general secretion pathway protein K
VSRRFASPVRQRGVAVITALLLTTLAITIVASLFWQQQVQVRSIENQRLQLQKQWILRGALDWARLILRADGINSTIDTLDEPWAVPLAETRLDQYVENGRADADASDAALSGSIIDAQSRYNLANLCWDGNANLCVKGEFNRVELAAFAQLLSSVRLDPALADAVVDVMISSQIRTEGSTPGTSKSRPIGLEHVEDLLAVPGFSPEAIDKLKEFIIVLPTTALTLVNVNTAPAEVLAARIDTLSLADANVLVASRKTASFRDAADFTNRLQGKSLGSGQGKIGFSTNFFLVNGKVSMNRAGLEVQALMKRENNPANPRTTLIWIREN